MIHFTILAVLLFCTRLTVTQNPATFWGFYPSCAVNLCLVPITTSTGCEIKDNECVCTTASFVTSVAECLGQKCPDIVYSVYEQYSTACQDIGGYTIAISGSQWEAAASSAASSASPQSITVQGTGLGTTTSALRVQQSPSSSNPNAAQPTTTTSTQPTTIDSAPSSSSTSDGSTSGGLTLDQKIALGVGIGIGVPSFIVAVIGVCVAMARR
jgi:hypothetical protein